MTPHMAAACCLSRRVAKREPAERDAREYSAICCHIQLMVYIYCSVLCCAKVIVVDWWRRLAICCVDCMYRLAIVFLYI